MKILSAPVMEFLAVKKEERFDTVEPPQNTATVMKRPLKREIEPSDDTSDDDSLAKKRRLILEDPFVYNALQPSNEDIRLLILLPSINQTDEVRCDVIHTALKASVTVPYDALSYTWGHPDDKAEQPIFVQGSHVTVSKNLDLALRALRYATEPRILWIDALCINQQSNREKSRQVSLMRKIYSLAQKTVVWLGEETRENTQAVDWISLISAENAVQGPCPWQDIIRFCRNSWFTRIWVVQEFVVGKNVEYLVGEKSFQAEKLKFAVRYLVDEGYIGFMSEGSFGVEETKQVSKMFQLKESRKAPVLSQILTDFRNRGSSVPHDKIYGLLGLFKELTLDPKLPLPDYDKAFRDVCTEWATYSLLNEEGLGILSSCEGPRSMDGWPSWVPDWSITGNLIGSLREVYPGWNASRGRERNISISRERLTISGAVIGTLAESHVYRKLTASGGLEDFIVWLDGEMQFRHKCE
jgi:hypothetical protein